MSVTVQIECDGRGCFASADAPSHIGWAHSEVGEQLITTETDLAGSRIAVTTGWLELGDAPGWTWLVVEVPRSRAYPDGLKFLCNSCASEAQPAVPDAA